MEWRVTECLPTSYEVSEKGDVRICYKDETMPVILSKSGEYAAISFHGKQYMVHRLVAEAFVQKPETYTGRLMVRHKDGNKSNNSADNLEWVDTTNNFHQSTEVKIVDIVDNIGFTTLTCAAAYAGVLPQILDRCIKSSSTICGHIFEEASDENNKNISKIIRATMPQIEAIQKEMTHYSLEELQDAMKNL